MLGIFESKKGAGIIPNTIIGGIGGHVTTKLQLANRLKITTDDIPYFVVDNGDVKAIITKPYSIPQNVFDPETITFYDDRDGLVTSLATSALTGQDKLVYVKVPNAASIGNTALIYSNLYKLIYAPKASIGNTAGDDLVFNQCRTGGLKVYVHPDMQTNNAGNPDGDLQYILGRSNQVFYGEDVNVQTAPNNITNLSIETTSATAFKLNFTPPSSVNAITDYEVYVNGELNNKTKAGNPIYASNLEPSGIYEVYVLAVDSYFNKSEKSNVISRNTLALANSPYITNSLTSFFQFDKDMVDMWGGFNGTNFGGKIIDNGKIGRAIDYDGTSYTTLPANIISGDEFTILFWVKANDTSADQRPLSLNNNIGMPYTSFRLNAGAANRISAFVYDGVDVNPIFVNGYTVTNWNRIGVRVRKNDRYDLIVNGAVVASDTNFTGFAQVNDNNNVVGAGRSLTNNRYKGSVDLLAFFNSYISDAEILEDWNNGNGFAL